MSRVFIAKGKLGMDKGQSEGNKLGIFLDKLSLKFETIGPALRFHIGGWGQLLFFCNLWELYK